MKDTTESNAGAATKVRLALNETYPDSTYGAVPALDQYDAVEVYRAFDDGGLKTVPKALAAYVDHHQHQWL
jgi:hypothetical protein